MVGVLRCIVRGGEGKGGGGPQDMGLLRHRSRNHRNPRGSMHADDRGLHRSFPGARQHCGSNFSGVGRCWSISFGNGRCRAVRGIGMGRGAGLAFRNN